MKIKQMITLVLSATLALTTAGCGGKAAEQKYAFVTDAQGTDSSAESALWQGIKEVADTGGVEAGLFKASADTTEAYQEVFVKAVEDKPSVVMATGETMEGPLYQSAAANNKIDYILFGGIPHTEETSTDTLPANTTAVLFAEHEQGFIAGYGAVCGGMRSLGVIVGEENESNVRHVNGFVQGVKKAAEDLGLENGSVSVLYEFAGSDILTPLRMSEALGLYGEGASLIYTTGENIVTAVAMAAKNQEKYYATGGTDHTDDDLCLCSAVPVYNLAARLILTEFNHEDFPKGTAVTYGYAEGCLELKSHFDALEEFNQEKYDAIVASLMLGTVKPDEKLAPSGSAAVTVTRIDPKDAEAASADVMEGGATAPTGAEESAAAEDTETAETGEEGAAGSTGEEAASEEAAAA